ncbi:hypothetical protein ACVRYP_05535 [Streptococcus rifensis]
MKKDSHKIIPFLISYGSLLLIWLTSEDTNPIWLKHVIYATTLLLLTVIFLALVFLSPSTKKRTIVKGKNSPQGFKWFYIIPSLLSLFAVKLSILSSELVMGTKTMILTGTFAALALISGLAFYGMFKKEAYYAKSL